jgi:hypothetical protein
MPTKRQRITDIVKEVKFHEEIQETPLTRNDLIDEDIIVYDVSETIERKKGGKVKYDSLNKLILFSFEEDETQEKQLAWVSGQVLIDQLEKLVTNGFDKEEGVLMTCERTGKYFKFV